MAATQRFRPFPDFLPLITKKQSNSGNCHNSCIYKILHNAIEVGQYNYKYSVRREQMLMRKK